MRPRSQVNLHHEQASSERPSFLKAPAFVCRYPPDFPDTERLAIDNARLEADRRIEVIRVLSYDEHKAKQRG
jgi:hypothetical protein